jgi:hypothetical protein
MKASELTGDALDWAVDKALNLNTPYNSWGQVGKVPAYSTDWALGGPIIERMGINIIENGSWMAEMDDAHHGGGVISTEGDTPLIAVMRCYVTSRLGDEINLPQHLLRGELI